MKSCYFLVNPLSESVRQNKARIEECIYHIAKKLHAKVFREKWESMDTSVSDWSEVDRQLNEAVNYEVVFVFGGDGTHAHVLERLAFLKSTTAFVGIKCGTMNIGTHSNCMESCFNFTKLQEKWIDAIVARKNGRVIGYSFIDSVITTTCVARVDGKIAQISAKGILNGTKEYDIPTSVGDTNTKITVYREFDTVEFPAMRKISTISAAFIPSELKAKVLAGGADPASCSGFVWGIVVSDFPLVWADATQAQIAQNVITSNFLPLFDNDKAIVSGLSSTAVLVNDGNAIDAIDNIEFSLERNSTKIYVLL